MSRYKHKVTRLKYLLNFKVQAQDDKLTNNKKQSKGDKFSNFSMKTKNCTFLKLPANSLFVSRAQIHRAINYFAGQLVKSKILK